MATRAIIAYLSEDKELTTTYNHYDGYPDGLGKTLLNHYDDGSKNNNNNNTKELENENIECAQQ